VAKARRAKRSAARFVVPIVAAIVLLFGGAVAAWKLWPRISTSASPTPSVEATQSTAAPSTATPSETTPTATPSPTKTPNPNAVKAQRALDACQAKVEAGDVVIKEAKTGVDHWAGHVNAQVLADRGAITISEMLKRFKDTRLKGPADQKRYHDALKDYENQDATCEKVAKAPSKISAALAKCVTKSKDQQPVLTTGAAGMRDWASHLAAMQRDKKEHVANAQANWVKAYRAAPRNINAFKRAVAAYDPPKC
jgi:hypothetical protein